MKRLSMQKCLFSRNSENLQKTSGISLKVQNRAPRRGKNALSQTLQNRSENTKKQILQHLPNENAKNSGSEKKGEKTSRISLPNAK